MLPFHFYNVGRILIHEREKPLTKTHLHSSSHDDCSPLLTDHLGNGMSDDDAGLFNLLFRQAHSHTYLQSRIWSVYFGFRSGWAGRKALDTSDENVLR